MGHFVTVATCSLNQWALDWVGNCERIIQSIQKAKTASAKIRVGPELEVTGYGCYDHYLEGDTYLHAWEMLAKIIQHEDSQDILLDIGMPVMHQNLRFNCRVLVYNKSIVLIRPKMSLANDGNYREMRWFTAWAKPRTLEQFYLPQMISRITGQKTVPFGDALISTLDTCLGVETCEELFVPDSPHDAMSLAGAEIIVNSSGSHHELRKLRQRVDLIVHATKVTGGCYIYANQQGCDGDRLYFDGCAMVAMNGKLLAQGSQFSLEDVEVVTATLDLEEIRSYRCSPSRGVKAAQQPEYTRIEVDVKLSAENAIFDPTVAPTPGKEPFYHTPEEEIALGPACWLWDYLRRSGAAGFFIPLSGGIDSCATSVMVFSMCRLVHKACHNGNRQALEDARRLCGHPEDDDWLPENPQEISQAMFHTAFMGTTNSSNDTRARAKDLAHDIGAYHTDMNIDTVVKALTDLFSLVTNFRPHFKIHGGSQTENLALLNIQARLRMVISYLWAQMLPMIRGRQGSLLVLGSANVDECLRGYLTKYDCSSADINPIGGISKTDLKSFIGYASRAFSLPILDDFLSAVPTAELEPITKDYVQSDEVDMGMVHCASAPLPLTNFPQYGS
ncbi:carbon-nitrogen hydrolase [Cryomyces antarcticus]